MEPRNYVLFSALYAPHMGGVEAYTAGMAHELVERGNSATVVTSRLSSASPECETQEDGVRIVRLPSRVLMGGRLPMPLRNARMAQLLEEVTAENPDRVVVNTRFYGMSLEGLRYAKERTLPAVMLEHGSASLSLGSVLADRALNAYETLMTKRVKAYAPTFAGVSQAACAWLGHFGIKTSRVVPNALDAQAYRASASARDFRNELGVREDDLLVAVVGRLIPEKGIQAVLEAARRIEGDESFASCMPRRIVFAIAGDGALLDQVKAAEAQTTAVKALGRLPVSDVAALLRASDIYLLPSRSEGFATTLLEACAMGAYPITTDVGGVAELGIGRLGGIVLPDASAASIIAALQVAGEMHGLCRQQAATLQANAARENTWGKSVEALESLFS